MAEELFPDLVLRTDRLTLRPFGDDDLDEIVVAASDPDTMRWLPLPRPYGREHAEFFVHEVGPEALRSGAGLIRAIEFDGALAGAIDFKHTDWRNRETEIGYWASPSVRGQGVLTEATSALARWALTTGGMQRVVLRVAPENVASVRVAVKSGFTYEGVARNAGFLHSGRTDLAIYSLIPSDLQLGSR